MPKHPDDIQDLKRRAALLGRLDGRALVCAEGLHLLDVGGVADVASLVGACRAGRPSLGAVRAAIELRSPPIAVTPSFLAAAQRDLRALAGPRVAGLVRGAPRLFRRHGEIDAAWLAAKQARLDRLAASARAAASVDTGGGALPAWFERVLDLVALVHGDDAAALVREAALHPAHDPRSAGPPRRPGTDAAAERERLLTFLAHASLTFDPRPRELDARAAPSAEAPATRALSPAIVGPGPRDAGAPSPARDAGPLPPARDAGPLPLARRDVELGADGIRALAERFERAPLRLPEVLALGRLPASPVDAKIARLVAEGLPVDRVLRLAGLGRAADLAKVRSGVEGAIAYAEWTIALVPHYASLGLDLPFSPELFDRLPAARKGDLAVLAMCLMKHHAKAAAETAEHALAQLDATLALFQRRPAEVTSILTELTGTTPGAGRAVMPDIADWLGDDALLDRHVHLSRLAGVPAVLSRTLRADFERGRSLLREREHLASMPSRTPVQQARLERLAAGQVAIPGPERTRRRLAERARELLARAYEARLDAALRRIAREAWGITVPRLTPGWRDAIRFYLVVEKNRELLATVLRTAASGADPARALPRNRAWITSVAGRFDVEAWLAPRSRDVEIGGDRYRLAVERDPIEVLRMGIPFDTCLSLEGGANAASTVVNAADANKRVLYLRDARGSIVARKLIAVSRDNAMLGYQLYIAARERTSEITAAFRDMCATIAEAARLPLASDGKPRQIHPGFWYDDGPEPFDAAPGAAPIEAYCRALGVPLPSHLDPDDDIFTDARFFAAVQTGLVDEVCAALAQGGDSWEQRRAAAWVVGRLDPARLVTEARRSAALAEVALRRAAEDGPAALMRLAGRVATWHAAGVASELFPRFRLDLEAAIELVDAAVAASKRGVKWDTDGLEHRTLDLLPPLACDLPVADGIALCDRVDPFWRWIADEHPDCVDCVDTARRRMVDALVVAYARSRDPAAVLDRLGRRSRPLVRRAALAIAARYALADDTSAQALPPPRLEPLRPCPAAIRALVRLRRRAPELEGEPDLLAAILRQSGGVPRGAALPVPASPPFEALADLLAQLDLAGVLAPWTEGDAPLATWKPGPWELHHHRRTATGLAARAAAEARAAFAADPLGDAAQEALQRLVLLGDAAEIQALLDATKGQSPVERKVRSRLAKAHAAAQEIAGQAASSRAADPLAAEHDRRARGRDKAARTDLFDQGLLLAAIARVERHIADPAEGGAPLDLALALVREADRSGSILSRVAAELVARRGGELVAADRDVFTAWLEGRSAHSVSLPPAVSLAMLGAGVLRDRVVAFVSGARDGSRWRGFRDLEAFARRVGRAHLVEGLFEEVVSAELDRGASEIGYCEDEELFCGAVRVVLGRGVAAAATAAYRGCHSHAKRALFLAELAKSPLRASAGMRTEARLWRESAGVPPPAALEWLDACLAGAPPEDHPPRSAPRTSAGDRPSRSAGALPEGRRRRRRSTKTITLAGT